MSSKTPENNVEEKPVPVRRSLRLSSCSPTPSVLSRDSTAGGSPHPLKLSTKRRLSSELSPNREKTIVTRSSARKISSIQEEPEIESKTSIKEETTEENVNEKLENDTRRTRTKSSSQEPVSKVSEESKTPTMVTRSRSNLNAEVENTTSEKKVKDIKKNLFVILEPLKEVSDDVTPENESQNVEAKNNEEKNQENGNKENVSPEDKNKITSPVDKTDSEEADDLSGKSQSDSFSFTSRASNLNDCIENSPQSEVFNVKESCGEEIKDLDSTDSKAPAVEEKSSDKSEHKTTENESKVTEINTTTVEEDKMLQNSEDKTSENEADVIKTDKEVLLETNEPVAENSNKEMLQIDIDEEPPKDASVDKSEANGESKVSDANNLDSKIDKLLESIINSEDESYEDDEEEEQNPFIDGMAEEGEEDTPSEGSNDIIEVGEEINTTDSEHSSAGSYDDKDSFIADDEEIQLLSGDEYDLSLASPKRKSRIIQLSSGSDEEIVKINRTKKEKPKKKRKSRIMKFSDSSDEEKAEKPPQENGICDSKEIDDAAVDEKELGDSREMDIADKNKTEDQKGDESLKRDEDKSQEILAVNEEIDGKEDDKKTVEDKIDADNATNEQNESSEAKDKVSTSITSKFSLDDFLESFKDQVQSEEEENVTASAKKKGKKKRKSVNSGKADIQKYKDMITSSTPNKDYVSLDEYKDTGEENKKTEKDQTNVSFNASVSYLNESSNDINLKKKIVVIENIRVQDIKDKRLSDQINELIDSWCSGVNEASDVTIKLSLNSIDKSTELTEGQVELGKEKLEEVTQKKKKKRRTRKRKGSLTLSSEENIEANNKVTTEIKVPGKKKKRKVLQKVENIIKIEEPESTVPKKKKKKRKQKHSTTEVQLDLQQKSEDEPQIKKIKKNKKTWKDNKEEIRPINIIEEAIKEDKKKKLILLTPDLSDSGEWNVKKRAIKPSLKPIENIDKIENKTIKCSTTENTKRFHVKDFKNNTLFDPKHVRRVESNQFLKKKMF